MEQHDRPPLIHLCLSLSHILRCTPTHTHANAPSNTHTHARPHSLRKSCFIYETYSSESHKVLLRFPDCSSIHSQAFLPYLLFFRLGQKTRSFSARPRHRLSTLTLGWPAAEARRTHTLWFVMRRGVQRKSCHRLNVREAEIPSRCSSSGSGSGLPASLSPSRSKSARSH